MNWYLHPISGLKQFFDGRANATCFLSCYTYAPSCITDNREIIPVRAQALQSVLVELDNRLSRSVDVAFHSVVVFDQSEEVRHIPMVDLSGGWSETAARRLSTLLKSFGCDEARLYSSGRSFHLYGLHHIADPQWRVFMARLLMLNGRQGQRNLINPYDVGGYLERLTSIPKDPTALQSSLSFCRNLISRQPSCQVSAPLEIRRVLKDEVEVDVSTITKLLCLLLLLNPRSPRETVDCRWVAHRLLAGYSTLRWTAHQERYLKQPRLVMQFNTVTSGATANVLCKRPRTLPRRGC